jgi:serine/threonine protein phosphatase 1
MDFGRIVVHEHTPSERPEVLTEPDQHRHRSVATGRLTCVLLESAERRFLMTA